MGVCARIIFVVTQQFCFARAEARSSTKVVAASRRFDSLSFILFTFFLLALLRAGSPASLALL